MESDHFTNLKQHRSDVDAWEPRAWWHRFADGQAVSLTSIAAVAVVLYGVTRRRSAPGMWWLVSGAVVGCAAASLGAGSWLRDTRFGSGSEPPADAVTQESVDSFPASDAPSSNATTAAAQPLRRDFVTD